MEISIFLAKVLGLYLLIIGLGLTINAPRYRTLLNDILQNPPLFWLAGMLTLVMGLLIVVSHNIWAADWRVVITIIGWLSLIKGIVRVVFLQVSDLAAKSTVENPSVFFIVAVINLILGIFLTYFGFYS